MPRRRASRAYASKSGQGRAGGRNERLGGNNTRPTDVHPSDVRRHDWPLTPAGRVMLPDVAAVCGVSRQAVTAAAELHGRDMRLERIPGRRGRPAVTVSPADADYLEALHRTRTYGPVR